MPKHPEQEREGTGNTNHLQLIQISLNKSERAHFNIINKKVSTKYDIMLIQEPYTTSKLWASLPNKQAPKQRANTIGNFGEQKLQHERLDNPQHPRKK